MKTLNIRQIFSFISIIILFISNSYSVTKIKFATVAPEGTTWMNAMHKFNNELKTATENRVAFIFYPGGIAGDEKDILRKMRYNKIHATGFTGLGMGKILKESRILDLPFFFDNDKEVDHVHGQLFSHFEQEFSKKGFELIAWSEVGWTYLFSKKDIQDPNKFKKLKMWAWEGDPIAIKTLQNLGMNIVTLSIADVLPSLQTGLIDSVYSPPIAAIALQWNTQVKYMLKTPIVHSSGAFLINKKTFSKIKPDDQKALKTIGQKIMKELTIQTRDENEKAKQDMIQKGIIEITPNEESLKIIDQTKNTIKKQLINDLYSQDSLNNIEKLKNEVA